MTEYYISSNLNNFTEIENLATNFPIHSACKDGNIDQLLSLLSTGSYNLSEVDDFYGWTPIHWAANFGNTQVSACGAPGLLVQLNLIRLNGITFAEGSGVLCMCPTELGSNGSDLIKFCSELACLQCLINTPEGSRVKGSDMLSTWLSQVPSHLYALAGHPQAPSSLIQYSCHLNTQDPLGETPIHKAARMGSMDCISLLVSQGAKLNIKNNSGYTPSQIAAMAGYLECAKYLENAERLQGQAAGTSPHLNPNNVCRSVNHIFNVHSNGETLPEGQPCIQHHSFISTNTYHSNPYVSGDAFLCKHLNGTFSIDNNQSDDCNMEMDDGAYTGNSCNSFGNGYTDMDVLLSAGVRQNMALFAGKKRARGGV